MKRSQFTEEQIIGILKQHQAGLGAKEWHRHVSLVMLAFAMMATIRQRANQPMPKKTKPRSARKRPTSSAGRSRKSVA